MALQNNHYFLSSQVKVFPCSYRGQNSDTGYIYDPESRIPTEQNLTSLGTDLRRSYLISFENNILNCMIGGYHFVINDVNATEIGNKLLYIDIAPIESSDIHTNILSPIGATALDSNDIFYGIYVSATNDFNLDTSLQPFNSDGSINKAAMLPEIITGKEDHSAGVGSNLTIDQPNLFVTGAYNAATEAGDLFIVGDGNNVTKSTVLQVNKNKVVVNKPATFSSTVTANAAFTVNQSATFNGNVNYNTGTITVNTDKLTINGSTGATTIKGPVTQTGAFNQTGTAAIGKSSSVALSATNYLTTINGSAYVAQTLTAADKIIAPKGITNTAAPGNVPVTYSIDNTGYAAFQSERVYKNFTQGTSGDQTGAADFYSATTIHNTLNVTSAIYTNYINDDTTALTVRGSATFSKSTVFQGQITAHSAVTVNNSVNVNGTLNVKKKGSSTLVDIFNIIYPVGSVYISMENSSPKDLFGVGNWTQLSGASLWAVTSGANKSSPQIMPASLPKLMGEVLFRASYDDENSIISTSGTFTTKRAVAGTTYSEYDNTLSKAYGQWLRFNSAKTNTDSGSVSADSIYTRGDNKVVPTAYKVYMWVRVS